MPSYINNTLVELIWSILDMSDRSDRGMINVLYCVEIISFTKSSEE